MQTTEENKEILTGLITCVDVQKLFARSDQSIAIWRKSNGLPFVVIPSEGRDAVRYRLTKILEWAELVGKDIDPEYLKFLSADPVNTTPAPKTSPKTKGTRVRRRFAEIND